MTDKFTIISIKRLLSIIFNELEEKNQIFNIPKKLFYLPHKNNILKDFRFGQLLETPIGVAAGPHTQLSQNIIASCLCGARFIELKTIQTLDELSISKPCIDMQDEGYNCEWSQELKISESFDQYLNAWIIIHILKDKFGWNSNNELGTIFNMSVGYDMKGILMPNVQWFFEKMKDCKTEKNKKIESLKNLYPNIINLKIPDCISDNITLSTMHGCPPEEIEKIGLYLIKEKKLHTTIKLNPTLIGSEKLHKILNDKSGFETKIPESAFQHDLKYPDAVNIIKSLNSSAKKNKVHFGIKLTNTLESINHKNIFSSKEKMMYMSGRALHPISINLAKKIQNEFNGKLDISFSAGADAFNISDIIACGLKPVTVCSDILKPGGYTRLNQYLKNLYDDFVKNKAKDINQFILQKNNSKSTDVNDSALSNLNKYADEVVERDSYKKHDLYEPDIKTKRILQYFDCIKAPCVETCPTHQNIPDYMYYASKGEFDKAFEVIINTNPFPLVTGMICDHLCQIKCTRINYDNSLLIREIKRFIAEKNSDNVLKISESTQVSKENGLKVAIIGAGPSGLSCAYFLSLAGFEVNVYESKSKAGGMISGVIPSFRLSMQAVKNDIKRIENTGVKIHYNYKVNKKIFKKLQENNHYIYLSTGAQLSKKIAIKGIDAKGVLDPLQFLSDIHKGIKTDLGNNVAVIGGGNTAMDAARTANRLVGENGKVSIIYRRTKKEMPADITEIKTVLEEGIKIIELTAPERINIESGRIKSLTCIKMILEDKDLSGRPKPVKIKGTEFDLQFDTIIPAIGQELSIDFIDQKLLKADTVTYLTKIKNLYIGGDAMRGASTAIKAIGDGRKIAEQIIKASQIQFNYIIPSLNKGLTLKEHQIKRAKREFAVTVQETNLHNRKNFNPVVKTLKKNQAV
ncbi:MAG: putative selenate reductase subunit YgfK, partial [Bacteroidales bacterium]|nr:putative selenate reductase subunit YgfK [Bacteroidales bacterium]